MGQVIIMARPILPDTDILVDFFRGRRKAVAFVNAHSARIILSSFVIAELYAGVKGSAEKAALENFVSLFRVVPVEAEIAKAGGLFMRDYGKSHGIGLADAILAATAEAENAEFKTLNTQHYPMLKSLRPAYKQVDT
jgi:predicted nucleic acid-binding protein